MTIFKDLKVAFIHDWLIGFGGAEKVLLAMHELFPHAPIYTSICNRAALPKEFNTLDIHPSFLQKFPMAKTKIFFFIFHKNVYKRSLTIISGYSSIFLYNFTLDVLTINTS